MTQRSNTAFMVSQLMKFVEGHDESGVRFDVEQANTDESMNSTFDEIMHYWVLPKAKRTGLTMQQVGDLLTAGNNTIPLWVRVEPHGGDLFRLVISRRFRKRKVVQDWHNGSATYPFCRNSK